MERNLRISHRARVRETQMRATHPYTRNRSRATCLHCATRGVETHTRRYNTLYLFSVFFPPHRIPGILGDTEDKISSEMPIKKKWERIPHYGKMRIRKKDPRSWPQSFSCYVVYRADNNGQILIARDSESRHRWRLDYNCPWLVDLSIFKNNKLLFISKFMTEITF